MEHKGSPRVWHQSNCDNNKCFYFSHLTPHRTWMAKQSVTALWNHFTFFPALLKMIASRVPTSQFEWRHVVQIFGYRFFKQHAQVVYRLVLCGFGKQLLSLQWECLYLLAEHHVWVAGWLTMASVYRHVSSLSPSLYSVLTQRIPETFWQDTIPPPPSKASVGKRTRKVSDRQNSWISHSVVLWR